MFTIITVIYATTIHWVQQTVPISWFCHQMEIFSAFLAFCAGNSPVTGEFPTQRAGTRSFDVFFNLRFNQQLSQQLRRRWFETSSRPLWRHYNVKPWSLVSVYDTHDYKISVIHTFYPRLVMSIVVVSCIRPSGCCPTRCYRSNCLRVSRISLQFV